MTNQSTTNLITEPLADRMFRDRKVRRAITRESHLLFFHLYFAHYVTSPTAPFHFELFRYTEEESVRNLVVVAFRGSGKSTLMTMSYPLWAILGKQQKKFVLILCQTRGQAKQHMMNVKRELESNTLLKNDLGPFQEESDEWGSTSLVFSQLNARITAASTEQSIRGLRHRQHRPDVIIGDDLEDLASTRTHEARQKTYDWLMGEVLPAGSRQTRLILVGNYLHDDALLMRIQRKIAAGDMHGVFQAYPLVHDDGTIQWPGMYPTAASIEKLRREKGEEAFLREYQLKIISPDGQIVKQEWIQRYDPLHMPDPSSYRYTILSADLASSQKTNADCTAIVAARVFGYGKDLKVLILPNPVNERMLFPPSIRRLKRLYDDLSRGGNPVKLIIEDVGFQAVTVQQLLEDGYPAQGWHPGSSDKLARLVAYSSAIQYGQVVFPHQGAEALIRQIVGFGSEAHDDLVDALTMLLAVVKEDQSRPAVHVCISKSSFYRKSREGREEWAEREDKAMFRRRKNRPHAWRRRMG